jgi:hypothetical protein
VGYNQKLISNPTEAVMSALSITVLATAAASLATLLFAAVAYGDPSGLLLELAPQPAGLALLAVGAELLFVWRFRAAEVPA